LNNFISEKRRFRNRSRKGETTEENLHSKKVLGWSSRAEERFGENKDEKLRTHNEAISNETQTFHDH
jgi:hypothetical protein